jgi:hypothetical protein
MIDMKQTSIERIPQTTEINKTKFATMTIINNLQVKLYCNNSVRSVKNINKKFNLSTKIKKNNILFFQNLKNILGK